MPVLHGQRLPLTSVQGQVMFCWLISAMAGNLHLPRLRPIGLERLH
jgi:hypothetical protein